MSVATPSPLRIENTIPVLPVRDVQTSIRFYRDVLGFNLDWGGDRPESRIASVSRDGHALMLQQLQPGGPGQVWIGCEGLAALWHAVRSRDDVTIVQKPINQPWALSLKLSDPDGNVLWFGTESLPDVQFGTEPDL